MTFPRTTDAASIRGSRERTSTTTRGSWGACGISRAARASPRLSWPRQLHKRLSGALAWLLSRGQDIVPIPGTKQVDRLEENVGAARVRLDPADLRQIDEAMPPGAGAGTRYPEPQMKGVYI